MQLVINDKVYEIDKESQPIDACVTILERYQKETGKALSHLVIDNEEVYTDMKEFLEQHQQHIEQVVAHFITLDELQQEIITTALQYLSGAIPSLEQLADSFSKAAPQKETWEQFGQMLEGLGWMAEVMQQLSQQDSLAFMKPQLSQSIEELQQQAGELEAAVNNQDYGLVSDLIRYEVAQLYKNLRSFLPSDVKETGE